MTGTILIVDDDADFVALCERAFRKKGYTVKSARNFYEALSASKEADVMVLDYLLGNPDGEEVLRHIRDDHNMIPVVMVSGARPDPDKIQRWREIGIYMYMTKPIRLGPLISAVEQAIGIKRVADLAEETCSRIEKLLEESPWDTTSHVNPLYVGGWNG